MRRALRALYRGWMAFAHALGRIQTFLLLAVVYFLVLGIIAVISRIVSRDLLDRRMHDRASVWSTKMKSNLSLDEARHLF